MGGNALLTWQKSHISTEGIKDFKCLFIKKNVTEMMLKSFRTRLALLLGLSDDARLHVLIDALVTVMKLMVVRPPGAGMKRGDSV